MLFAFLDVLIQSFSIWLTRLQLESNREYNEQIYNQQHTNNNPLFQAIIAISNRSGDVSCYKHKFSSINQSRVKLSCINQSASLRYSANLITKQIRPENSIPNGHSMKSQSWLAKGWKGFGMIFFTILRLLVCCPLISAKSGYQKFYCPPITVMGCPTDSSECIAPNRFFKKDTAQMD